MTGWSPRTAPRCRCARWLPEGQPRAVILALHGFNDYSNAFAAAGAGLVAQDGIAIYAYDQRGFGAAPHRGRWAGADSMADDAATPRRCCGSAIPTCPLYLLGESMGGAVAILAATARGRGAESTASSWSAPGGVGPADDEHLRARRRCGSPI